MYDYEEVRVEITRDNALASGTAVSLWIRYSLNDVEGRLNTANANLLMRFCRGVIWCKGALAGGEMSRGNTVVGQTFIPNADVALPSGATPMVYELQFATDAAWGEGDTIKVYGKRRS